MQVFPAELSTCCGLRTSAVSTENMFQSYTRPDKEKLFGIFTSPSLMAAKRKNKQRSLNKINTVLFSLSVSPKLQISDLLWPNQTLNLNPLLPDSHLSQVFNVDIKDLTI